MLKKWILWLAEPKQYQEHCICTPNNTALFKLTHNNSYYGMTLCKVRHKNQLSLFNTAWIFCISSLFSSECTILTALTNLGCICQTTLTGFICEAQYYMNSASHTKGKLWIRDYFFTFLDFRSTRLEFLLWFFIFIF